MKANIPLDNFLEFFPVAELPMTIGEETVRAISQSTEPLPGALIETFIHPLEEAMVNDDFTEFVACLKLPPQEKYTGIVYWRADLLQYHYVLVTLDNKTGEMIARQVIAGTSFDGEELLQSSSAITEDLTIYIVSGQGQAMDYDYSASGSTAQRYQVTAQGKIVEV
jgi:hypothetical protein